VLALVIAVVTLCPSQLFAQFFIQRAWPLHVYQANSRHYHVLAAPAQMARPSLAGRSVTAINAAGQVLVTNFIRTTLWTPPSSDTTSSYVVGFDSVFDISLDSGTIVGSALNSPGQVAGVVRMSNANVDRSTVFLWTPQHTQGSDGVPTSRTLLSTTHSARYGR
jgi:hypothetical protein